MSTFLIKSLYKNASFDWSVLTPVTKLANSSPVLSAKQHSANVTWGGAGSISGIITTSTTSSARKVRLYESSTGVLVREVWSASNGAYSFTGLRTDIKYTVSVADDMESFNDAIAARVSAV